jgi:hypothetical protein
MMSQEMTRVRVGLKFVKNLGNYESIHVDVGIEDYVREKETVDAAFERVYEYVEGKLVEKVREIEEDLGGK